MHSDDTDALLRLLATGGPSAPRRQLLAAHASPAAALEAGPRAWREAGLSEAQQNALRGPAPREQSRSQDWLQAPDHHLLGWHDPDYPALLRRAPS
ncbi:MAG: DNA-protecting protein DprA, partial [Lysobacter sp.]|nr:DNA-protecting protein DprA [Lysobacter sp.]